eukprot:TRINITY_DN713_c0_g1_i2.p1 TRINITY_DN713_c0_g1~~TRINITY_DN713_c0_g1_i2.p1  ORF type:complete len:2312 (-),score=949.79 TRINITY_DN713_c0_g1_i2:135-6083(-)
MTGVTGVVESPRVVLDGLSTAVLSNVSAAINASSTLDVKGFQVSVLGNQSVAFDSELTNFVDAIYDIEVDSSTLSLTGEYLVAAAGLIEIFAPGFEANTTDLRFHATQSPESELVAKYSSLEVDGDEAYFQAPSVQISSEHLSVEASSEAAFTSDNNFNVDATLFQSKSLGSTRFGQSEPLGGITFLREDSYLAITGAADPLADAIELTANHSISVETTNVGDVVLEYERLSFHAHPAVNGSAVFSSRGGQHVISAESQTFLESSNETTVSANRYGLRAHELSEYEQVAASHVFKAARDVEFVSDKYVEVREFGDFFVNALGYPDEAAEGKFQFYATEWYHLESGNTLEFDAGGSFSAYSGVDYEIDITARASFTFLADTEMLVHTAGLLVVDSAAGNTDFEARGEFNALTDEYKTLETFVVGDLSVVADNTTNSAVPSGIAISSLEGDARFDVSTSLEAVAGNSVSVLAVGAVDVEAADVMRFLADAALDMSSAGAIELEADGELSMTSDTLASFDIRRELAFASGGNSVYRGEATLTAPVVRLGVEGQTLDDLLSLDTLVNGTLTFEAGQFLQSGGGFHLTGDGVEMRAHEYIFLSAVEQLDVHSWGENVTMEAFRNGAEADPGTITWRADDLDVNGDGVPDRLRLREFGVDVHAATVRIESKEGDDIEFKSARELLVTSNNEKDITSKGAGDRIVVGAEIRVKASGSVEAADGTREAISFESTGESADVVVLARDGYTRLEARDSVEFTSQGSSLRNEYGKIFATDDVVVVGTAGGVNVQVGGSRDSDVYDADVGAVFRSEADLVDVRVYAEKQEVYLRAAEAARVASPDGSVVFDAALFVDFVSYGGDVQVDAPEGFVELKTDIGNMAFVSGKDVDVQASNRLSLVASDTVTLVTLDRRITDPDGLAFEFASDSSHVAIDATGSGAIVQWVAGGDLNVASGLGTAFTSVTGTLIETQLGELVFRGESGATFNVTDGDTTVRATEAVRLSSGVNEHVGFQSGLALSGSAGNDFALVAGGGADVRSLGGNVLFETEAATGDLSLLADGFVGFQADGTDNSVGTGGVDGIFVRGQNVDLAARDTQTWEVERQLVVGANTRPQVQIESGGDGTFAGFVWQSEGSTQFVSQRSFDVDASFGAVVGARETAKFVAVGNIEVGTTGTSSLGKTVEVSASEALDVDALNVLAVSEQQGEVSSERGVRLESVGTSAVTNYVKVHSANVFRVDAERWTGEVGSWTGALGSLDASAFGDVLLSTTRGGTGDVLLQGESLLRFEADLNLNARSVGTGATLTMRTTSPNSPISFNTDAPTSAVRLYSDGELTGVAETDVIVTGEFGVSITAFDNSFGGDAGDFTVDAFGDIELESEQDLVLGGARGVLLETAGGGSKDVELTTFDGGVVLSAREAAAVNANGGDFSVTSSADLRLGNVPGGRGSVVVESATDIDFEGGSDVALGAGDDFRLEAGAALIVDPISDGFQPDGLYLSTTDDDAQLSVESLGGRVAVTVDGDTELFSDAIAFDAYGDLDIVGAGGQGVRVTTDSDRGMSIDIWDLDPSDKANSLVIGSSLSVQLHAYGTSTQEGFVDVSAGGALLFGNDLPGTTLYNFGSLQGSLRSTIAGEFAVESDTITLEFDGSDESTYNMRVSEPTAALTLAGDVANFVASSSLRIEATDETDVGGALHLSTDGAGTVSATDNVVIEARSPHADVLLRATDFIDGDISFLVASGVFDAIGHEGFVLQTVDDDDLDVDVTFAVESPFVALAGSGGDVDPGSGEVVGLIVETSRDAAILFDSGADLNVVASDNIEMSGRGEVALTATAAVQVGVANGFELSALGNLTVAAGTATFDADDQSLIESAGRMLLESEQALLVGTNPTGDATQLENLATNILVEARGPVLFTGASRLSTDRGRPVDITTESIMRIPFLFPRQADGSIPMNPIPMCSGTNTMIEYMGGLRSLWFDPDRSQLCYCRPLGGGSGTVHCYT